MLTDVRDNMMYVPILSTIQALLRDKEVVEQVCNVINYVTNYS